MQLEIKSFIEFFIISLLMDEVEVDKVFIKFFRLTTCLVSPTSINFELELKIVVIEFTKFWSTLNVELLEVL